MSVPSNLSNKLVTTNALWDILGEVTTNIYNNMPQPVDISGKADKSNPIFYGTLRLGYGDSPIVLSDSPASMRIGSNTINGYSSIAIGSTNSINSSGNYSLAQGQKNCILSGGNNTALGESNFSRNGSFTQGKGTFADDISFANGNGVMTAVGPLTRTAEKTVQYGSGYYTQIHNINPIAGDLLLNPSANIYVKITSWIEDTRTFKIDNDISSNISTAWYLLQGPFAIGQGSHAEGTQTKAFEIGAHVEGRLSRAEGQYSHAEGLNTITTGHYSHAEGYKTTAQGTYSHSEGEGTKAIGTSSHAEGFYSTAEGERSHAEGTSTAKGIGSHAEGYDSEAIGDYSHAEGHGTEAYGAYSLVFGQYNLPDKCESWPEWTSNTAYAVGDKVKVTSSGLRPTITAYKCNTANNDATFTKAKWDVVPQKTYVEIVGNGIYDGVRSNARTLDWAGNEWLAGNLTAAGGTFTLGATALTEAQLQALKALPSAIGDIHSFDVQVVQALPTQDIETHTIYFVPKTGATNDVYDEYLYINNQWEMIGNTQIDLTGYALTSAIPTRVSDLTDDSGHYTKPSGGIPASDLAETYATQTYVDNALAGKVVSVEGTTPAITAVADTQYICGEVSTLSFTPSATGTCDVIFQSGATATVLTVPSTVKFPEWFDTSALEANMTYEINITNGVYGAVMAWPAT